MANNTNFTVKYELDTIDARVDVDTLTAQGQRADISQLDDVYWIDWETEKFVTQEHNYTVLDGSFSLQDFEHISYISNTKSRANGTFAVTPRLDFQFHNYHKSFAITLYCIEDAPVEARITWYRNTLKVDAITATLDPNKRINSIVHPISGYNRCVIEITKALPDRYAKIDYIEFGTTMRWDETVIKDGTLVKELSRDGSQLSIDTLTFSIVDNSYNINLANPNGIHTLFQRDQQITAYEELDGVTLSLGKFFLDSYTAEGNAAKINAVSYIGVLDRFKFIATDMYNNTLASDIISEIFTAAGISSDKYIVDSTVGNQRLTGTIKPCTCKEAMQQVMFACHGTIDSTNPEKIQISQYSKVIGNRIERKDKIRTKVSEVEAVNQVRLKYKTYTQDSSETEIFSDTYPAGSTQTVYFDVPYYGLRIAEGADWISSTTYSITFAVDSSGNPVTVMGHPYSVVERTLTKNTQTRINTNNIIEFETDLCSTSHANTLLNELAEYYGNALRIEIQHYANDADMNTISAIENQLVGLDNYIGVFEERTFNLTGGFLDSAKLRGYYDETDKNYYTGDDRTENSAYELFTGDIVPIL